MKQVNTLGFDRTSQSWVTRTTGKSAVTVPPLDGKLLIDDSSLDAAADDFGHLRHHRPIAVLEPGSIEDIVQMIGFAREHGIKIGPRGAGHTSFGQSQVEGGVLIKMSTLQLPIALNADEVEVSSGMTWHQVLTSTFEHDTRPPVLTHNTFLSVGGTLSVGGIDGGSYRYGAQVDNVLALQVVTGEGRLETCSPSHLPELFNASLAGLGQCAIILRATLRLIPAPSHTLFFELLYRDLPTMLSDVRLLMTDGRFDRISSYALPSSNDKWLYVTKIARNFTPPALPDQEFLLAGLNHLRGFERVSTYPYLVQADLGSQFIAGLRANGRINLLHPWFHAFIPDSVIDEFAAEVLASMRPSEIERDFPIELFPFNTTLCARPLFRLPNEPVAFLINVLNTVSDQQTAGQIITRNQKFYERMRELGGKQYSINALPLTQMDWQKHFDPFWEQFANAKRRFDPDNILSPGPGIFPTIAN